MTLTQTIAVSNSVGYLLMAILEAEGSYCMRPVANFFPPVKSNALNQGHRCLASRNIHFGLKARSLLPKSKLDVMDWSTLLKNACCW